MEVALIILHIAAAGFLITVVLMQHGKGADIGAAFGGGASQTVFGSRGAGNFLTKLTTAFVVLFMITSVSLSYLSAPRSVFDEQDLAPAPETDPGAAPIEEGEPGLVPEGFESLPTTEAPKQDAAPSPAAEEPSNEPASSEGTTTPAEPGTRSE